MWALIVMVVVMATAVKGQTLPLNAEIMTSFSGTFSITAEIGDLHLHQDVLTVRLGSRAHLFTVQNLGDFVTQSLKSEHDTLTISSASVFDSQMWITAGATVAVQQGATRRSRRASASGTLSVLAILCSHNGAVGNGASSSSRFPNNLPDAATLSRIVFGTTGHATKAQLSACSNDAVTLEMATNPSQVSSITDGVLHVVVDSDMSTMGFSETINTAYDFATVALGGAAPDDLYDLVMVFQPGETYAGTATLSGTNSRYRGSLTTHISTHLHELGHSFGLGHANENDAEYGDGTGTMGCVFEPSPPFINALCRWNSRATTSAFSCDGCVALDELSTIPLLITNIPRLWGAGVHTFCKIIYTGPSVSFAVGSTRRPRPSFHPLFSDFIFCA
jgi:hypothetical protein